MAFIAGTPIFTDSGYKNIEDISGHDKILIRNFIGYAEFIQPFALKKKQYSGDIIKIGGTRWSLSATPEHIIVYDKNKQAKGQYRNSKLQYCPIKDIELIQHNKINRGFKYTPINEYAKENIVITDKLGNKRHVTIQNEDWFVFAAYVLSRGRFKVIKNRKLSLGIALNTHKYEQELKTLGSILNKLGIGWELKSAVGHKPVVKINHNNTLASHVAYRLGSRVHGEMYLTDKMIYDSKKSLIDLFISTIISLSRKKDTKIKDDYQLMTNNKKFLDSLVYACTLWGYSTNSILTAKKGTDLGRGPVKKNIYTTNIRNIANTYVPQYKTTAEYSGPVFEIDIFEGQVYAKEGTYPIWVNPK